MKRILSVLAALATAAAVILAGPQAALAANQYYYAAGFQSFSGTLPTGITANVSVYSPAFDTTKDSHTLTELAVRKTINVSGTNYTQDVEVGWTKDQGFGDTNVHLWTSIWVNGAFQGYGGPSVGFIECNGPSGSNTCGQSTDVFDYGDTLTSGTTMRLGLQYNATGSTGWWVIAYLSTGTFEYLGYWPTSKWSGATPSITTFTNNDTIYAFGEVATNSSGVLGCSDMGDGTLATGSAGGVIGSVSAVGLPTSAVDIDAGTNITDSSKFNFVAATGSVASNVRTVRYGGPGAC